MSSKRSLVAFFGHEIGNPITCSLSTQTELAYIAGLFDGEGHIGFYTYKATKNGRRYARLVVGITNTYLPVLEWVREVVGGGRIQRKRVRAEGWLDCYSFVIQGLSARALLIAILPYLQVKRTRAEFVLSQKTYGPVLK